MRKLGHSKVSIAGEDQTNMALTCNDTEVDLHIGPYEHAWDRV